MLPTPKKLVSSSSALLFFAGIVLGGIVWLFIFVAAYDMSSRQVVSLVLLLGCGGAIITGAVTAAIQPQTSILWSTGFALPMFGWGLLCAVLVPLNSAAIFCWTFYGVLMAAASVFGAWLGRSMGRYFAKTSALRDDADPSKHK